MHPIFVPAEPSDLIPAGAAVLLVRAGSVAVFHHPRLSFAECCARAVTHGRVIPTPDGLTRIGEFNRQRAEVHPYQGPPMQLLQRWIGRPIYRNELTCRDSPERTDRRAQARRLTMQGRTAEAFLLDRRLGL